MHRPNPRRLAPSFPASSPKSRARSCSSHSTTFSCLHVLGSVFTSSSFSSSFVTHYHCTLSNAFGSYTRCASNSSYPIQPPIPYPLAITREPPVPAALIIPRSVRTCINPSGTQHSTTSTRPSTPPLSSPALWHFPKHDRPPAHAKRRTSQPLSQTTQLRSFPAGSKLTVHPVIHDP